MTAKEKLLREAPRWSEAEAGAALRVIELARERDQRDLEALIDAEADELLDELDAEEAEAGFGSSKK